MRISAALIATLLAIVVTPMLAQPSRALAHPLGNFTINRYSRIELAPGEVRVRYVLDLAEIPTFTESDALDTDRDGQISDAEAAQYAERKARELARGVSLAVNGQAVPLGVRSQEIGFPPGQGGLKTLRLAAWFAAPLPEGTDRLQLDYRDNNYANRVGWKEVVVRAADGVSVLSSTAPDRDESDELRSYPVDLLKSPLDRREASATFSVTGVPALIASASSAKATAGKSSRAVSDSRFASLITTKRLTIGFVLFALMAAIGFGALHSLGPGHGKTVVAAYLVGARGTAKHAVFLGLTVTATHTISVFALGLATLFLQRFIAPEKVFLWLGVASGLFVVALGLGLFAARLRKALQWRRQARAAEAHDHGQEHPHGHGHNHDGGYVHVHDHAHEHSHGHQHGRGEHLHGHEGERGHSHLPPGVDGQRVTWRTLLALGISGGLLPCPSALVVMLAAIALDRVAFGLLLVVAFSVGLAGTLTAIGLFFVYARGLSGRLRLGGPASRLAPLAGQAVRLVPIGSALVITAAGALITLKALSEAGLPGF